MKQASARAELPNEDQLVAALAHGDRRAFDAVYAHYKDYLFGYLMRAAGGDRARAEDVAQTTWIQVMKSAHLYTGPNRFGAWLFQIARNAFLKSHRGKWENDRSSLEELAESGQSPEAELPGADAALIEFEDESSVKRAMDALPERQRALLLDRLVGEYSYEELAKTHGMTIPAVKGLLFRARAALIAALGKDSAG